MLFLWSRPGFTAGAPGVTRRQPLFSPLHDLSLQPPTTTPGSPPAHPSLLCKHYKLAICIWMGPQPLQEGDDDWLGRAGGHPPPSQHRADIRSPLSAFNFCPHAYQTGITRSDAAIHFFSSLSFPPPCNPSGIAETCACSRGCEI